MDTQTLDWSGSYKFEELLKSKGLMGQFDVPGVYLWLRPGTSKKKKIISYVGKAVSLWWRQLEHYRLQIGVQYTIPKEFRPSKNKMWYPSWTDNGEHTHEKYMNAIFDEKTVLSIVEEGFQLAKSYEIFLCPLKKGQEKDVERNLLWDFQPEDTKWGTGSEPGDKIKLVHSNADFLLSDEISEFFARKNRKTIRMEDGIAIMPLKGNTQGTP